MEFVKAVFGWNYILSVSLCSWFVAQLLKTIINAIVLGKFDLERMWGSGGLPSAHSATVCSMVVATGRYSGGPQQRSGGGWPPVSGGAPF